MIQGRLNQSLINGMFNSRSRLSMHEASLTISEESRLEPRPLPNCQNKIFLQIAHSQLNKFNECIEGLSKRSDTIIDCFKKIEGMKDQTKNTEVLRKRACNNIDALKQQVIISRTTNVHKLRVQIENMKSQSEKKQIQLKQLESAIRSLSLENQTIGEKFKSQIKQINHQLEVKLTMETMIVQVEKSLEIDALNSQIQSLTHEIQRSRGQQQSLLGKTRTLEERLRISESGQPQSRQSSIYTTFDAFGPPEKQLSEMTSSFYAYIESINSKLNALKQETNPRKQDIMSIKHLSSNLQVFKQIVQLLKKVDYKQMNTKVDLSIMPQKAIRRFNLQKKYKMLENQNKNLIEVNNMLKQSLLGKLEFPDQDRLKEIKDKLKQAEDKAKESEIKYRKAKCTLQKAMSKINEGSLQQKRLEFELNKQRVERRRLHNQVEDLKGNIRVFCRIRPLFSNQSKMAYKISSDTLFFEGKKRQFKYDAIFGEQSSQEEVFEETRRLVTSAIDGYNVCILAYGQTGSGKTFTVIGEESNPGISIRCIQELFAIKNEKKSYMKIDIHMSLVELHVDTFKDLLGKKETKGPIQQNYINHHSPLHDCKFFKAEDAEPTIAQFKKRVVNRKTSSTAMNETSSRSHLILTFLIESENFCSGEKLSSKFSIVDLAGSQSLDKSCAKNFQVDECKAINLGLFALKSVITGLNNKDSHIKYRSSKLTHFLRDSIGGNAKTLMFVNISPAEVNQQQTFSSLDFANGVKKVERLPPKVQTVNKGALEEHRRSVSTIYKPIHQ